MHRRLREAGDRIAAFKVDQVNLEQKVEGLEAELQAFHDAGYGQREVLDVITIVVLITGLYLWVARRRASPAGARAQNGGAVPAQPAGGKP